MQGASFLSDSSDVQPSPLGWTVQCLASSAEPCHCAVGLFTEKPAITCNASRTGRKQLLFAKWSVCPSSQFYFTSDELLSCFRFLGVRAKPI